MSAALRRNIVLAVCVLPLVLSACSSPQLLQKWRDPSYTSGPLKKILVVAVRKNQQTRRLWEDGFSASMSSYGVDVTPSYRIFPDSLPDTGYVHDITKERNFDGIILVGKVSTETVEGATASTDMSPSTYPLQPWNASYNAYYSREYYPGYPVISENMKDEIRIWATQGAGRMIWTGVGEVEGSEITEDVRRAIVHLIVPELIKEGVIAGGK